MGENLLKSQGIGSLAQDRSAEHRKHAREQEHDGAPEIESGPWACMCVVDWIHGTGGWNRLFEFGSILNLPSLLTERIHAEGHKELRLR
jgi:hypothetical protein